MRTIYLQNCSVKSVKDGTVIIKTPNGPEHIYHNASIVSLTNAKIVLQVEKWIPSRYDKYYYITDQGEVNKTSYDTFFSCHKARIAVGNCFQSYEEAQAMLDNIKKLKIMKNYTLKPETNADGMLCYKIPDEYESFSIQEGMIILKPKKPIYPKTYEECCDKTNFKGGFKEMLLSDDEYSLYISFIKLKRCRDAYWKIAGEQMGLGKSWEPDWSSFSEGTYPTITKCNGRIVKTSIYTHDCPLAFPTAEMRDAFYENFKDLIEQCKELL